MSLPTRIGRYDIVEMVGRGGMGAVYRGRDTVLERDVAIKVMSAEYVEDEERRARFYREARAAAKLQHRNIITVFEFGEHDGYPYMVMEFLRGMDLQRRMRTAPPIPLDQKLDFAIGLLQGLGLAHQNGVIHRDVKPANLWILDDGTVKLLDFGIAKLGATTSTQHAGVMGTVAYMSPEQVSGRQLDGRSDIFSAGVVLYELLAGRKPFEGETVTEVMVGIIERQPPPIPDLPGAIRAVLDKALEKNPDQRYQTAYEFAADLQLLRTSLRPDSGSSPVDLPLRGAPAETLVNATRVDPHLVRVSGAPVDLSLSHGEPAPNTTAPAPSRKNPLVLGLVAIVVVAAIGVAGWKFTRGSDPGESTVTAAGDGKMLVTREVTKMTFASTPPGATVEVNGTALDGVTPATRELPGTPPYQVTFTLAGYQPKTAHLADADLAAGRFEVALTAVPVEVTVQVTAAYEFELYRQGRLASRTATSHAVKAVASEALVARAPAYFLESTVTIPAKPGPVVRLTLPPLGRLSVRTSLETCEVTIDGRSAGFPPLTDQEVVSGSHILGLKCPDGAGPRQPLTIPAGGAVVALCQASGCQVQLR